MIKSFNEFINEEFSDGWKDMASLHHKNSRTAEYSPTRTNGWECKSLLVCTPKGHFLDEIIPVANIEKITGFTIEEFSKKFSQGLEIFLSSPGLEKKFETYKQHTIVKLGVVLIEGQKGVKNKFYAPQITNSLDGLSIKYNGSVLWASCREGKAVTFLFSDDEKEDIVKLYSYKSSRMKGAAYDNLRGEEYIEKFMRVVNYNDNSEACFTIYNTEDWKDLIKDQAEGKTVKPKYEGSEEPDDYKQELFKWNTAINKSIPKLNVGDSIFVGHEKKYMKDSTDLVMTRKILKLGTTSKDLIHYFIREDGHEVQKKIEPRTTISLISSLSEEIKQMGGFKEKGKLVKVVEVETCTKNNKDEIVINGRVREAFLLTDDKKIIRSKFSK